MTEGVDSNPSSPAVVCRPRSVVWAGRICLFMGVVILAMQSWMTSRGLVDLASWVQGVLYLVAAIFIYGRPRRRITYVIGGLALVFITIRCFTAVVLIYTYPRTTANLWTSMAEGLALALCFLWLTVRFICGAPSRVYHRIE